MRWRGRRTSDNIVDRRGEGGFGGLRGGLGGGRRVRMPIGGGKMGIGGAVILLVLALVFGVDPAMLLGGGGSGFTVPQEQAGPNTIDDDTEQFVGVVLADTEEVWSDLLSGQGYAEPKLVLFSGGTVSACGAASAAAGPFYCPGDRQIYLDTDFFRVMEQRLGAEGDFAAAYVVAHEVAHHVQNLLGILPEVNSARARAGEAESNRLSVMVELQADCFSGVWARHAEERFGTLEPGDIDEALNAASQIGDDTLQRNAGRAVVPDSFTHGTSKQRMRWFGQGYESGDPNGCDTFNAAEL
jgi:predicted metalloprotease